MAHDIINVRSPYWVLDEISPAISITDTLQSIGVKIWSGDLSSPPATTTYVIEKDLVYTDKVNFEISELVKDYIDMNPVYYENNVVWVTWTTAVIIAGVPYPVDTGEVLAADGYGYFEEGANPTNTNLILSDAPYVEIKQLDTTFTIPVYSETIDNVIFGTSGGGSAVAVVDSDLSYEKIQYPAYPIASTSVADLITCYFSSSAVDTLQIRMFEDCKYQSKKITFVNKYGALENIYMRAKKSDVLNTSAENYKSNTAIANGTYSISDHVEQEYSLNGVESHVLSTGFINESVNEIMRQLLLSENVWLTIDGNFLPVIISNKTLSYKTVLNDKLINYTFTFKDSFDKINNIR